jgi:hypothetical protein
MLIQMMLYRYFAFFGGDLSWYVTKMELYAFWLQHILMTVVPFYYLAIGRFNTKRSSLAGFLTIYTLTVIYHRSAFAFFFLGNRNVCRRK